MQKFILSERQLRTDMGMLIPFIKQPVTGRQLLTYTELPFVHECTKEVEQKFAAEIKQAKAGGSKPLPKKADPEEEAAQEKAAVEAQAAADKLAEEEADRIAEISTAEEVVKFAVTGAKEAAELAGAAKTAADADKDNKTAVKAAKTAAEYATKAVAAQGDAERALADLLEAAKAANQE